MTIKMILYWIVKGAWSLFIFGELRRNTKSVAKEIALWYNKEN